MPEPSAFRLPRQELDFEIDRLMSVVIEDGVVRSTVQDLPIPDVDVGAFFRSACRKFKDRTALVGPLCIGSRIAQLCDLFLAARGRTIKGNLKEKRIMDIFRYVNDFLILHTEEVGNKTNECKQTVLQCFQECCPELVFTHELPVDMGIKFLDLKLEFKDSHVCWTYEPRSSKGFLSFDSGHSKTIKRSVADTALLSALNKSCHHNTESSFKRQSFCLSFKFEISNDGGSRLLEKNDIMLGVAPFTHVSGLWLCSTALSVGATVIMLSKNEPKDVIPAIEKYKVTQMIQFPTFAQRFLQCPLVDKYDLSTLKKLIIGGSTTPTVVARGIIDKLKLKSFRHVYGLSETCGAIAVTPASLEHYESVGMPNPLTQMKVVDVGTGKKLGPHQRGEVCVKSIYCVRGYFNKPEATAKLYDDEGFLKTGDIGYYTKDGYFYIVDRIKELIKCMDQQVAPAELEDLLLKHEAVKEVVVTGVPHPDFGEAARAYVVLFQGFLESKALEGQLKKLIADQSAPHKQLHGGIEFVSNIPKSDTGKNLRRALRDSYMKRLVAAGK
ncbi:unnamed protein product [Ixodes persulcatus]